MLPPTKKSLWRLELYLKYEADLERTFLDDNCLSAITLVRILTVVLKPSCGQVVISLIPSELAKVALRYFSRDFAGR